MPYNDRGHSGAKIGVVVIFAGVCILASAAQPIAKRSHDQKVSAMPADPMPDLRGTEQRPLVVRAIPVPTPQADVARAEAEVAEHAKSERITAYSTLGLTAVTALLAIFTFLLWYANRRLVLGAEATAERQAKEMQASIAEATRSATAVEQLAEATKSNASIMSLILHKQMRAYIAVQPGGGVYQDDKNNFGSYPVLVNTGLSPARNVNHSIRTAILDTNTPPDFAYPEPVEIVRNNATLAAHQSVTMTAIVPERYAAAEVAEFMKGDKKRLFVWGTVTYDDVFDGHWETRFCHNFVFYKVDDEIKVNSWYSAGHNSTT